MGWRAHANRGRRHDLRAGVAVRTPATSTASGIETLESDSEQAAEQWGGFCRWKLLQHGCLGVLQLFGITLAHVSPGRLVAVQTRMPGCNGFGTAHSRCGG